MQVELIGYLMGALEVEELRQVEQLLLAEAEARQQLEILRRSFAPLEADREQADAPRGLAIRTCQRIHELRITTQFPAQEL
jgi:anti-sigma-K factor RskA